MNSGEFRNVAVQGSSGLDQTHYEGNSFIRSLPKIVTDGEFWDVYRLENHKEAITG